MPESILPPASDELQFATAEPGDVKSPGLALGKNCVACAQPIVSTYFAVGDKVLCPTCCAQINAPITGSKLGRLFKASLMGVGAGLLGALIWFAIRRIAHLEIGLIAILVGFMVGKAVHKGSGGRGGRGYQVLAVVITYCCIAANYMPDIMEALIQGARDRQTVAAEADEKKNADGTSADDKVIAGEAADPEITVRGNIGIMEAIAATALLFTFVFAFALAAPFLEGAGNVIGLLIIGFALWEAWKLNARSQLSISGPYQLGPSPVA